MRIQRSSSLVLCVVAVGYLLAGSAAKAQAQTIVGRWEHQGKYGVSFIHFHEATPRVTGALEGYFTHHIFLDNGSVVEGRGTYVLRSFSHNRGQLVLIFHDGHRTRMHEHTLGHNTLLLEHHGMQRVYVRQ